jgi:predicted nucleotidyltransferase
LSFVFGSLGKVCSQVVEGIHVVSHGLGGCAMETRFLAAKLKFLRIGNQPVRVEIHAGITGVDFATCFARAEMCDVKGIPVRFIGLADLRANKQAAGRTKDLADLEALPPDRHESK